VSCLWWSRLGVTSFGQTSVENLNKEKKAHVAFAVVGALGGVLFGGFVFSKYQSRPLGEIRQKYPHWNTDPKVLQWFDHKYHITQRQTV